MFFEAAKEDFSTQNWESVHTKPSGHCPGLSPQPRTQVEVTG